MSKTKYVIIRRFKDGEGHCRACGQPLPAHETWPGFRYRICGRAECTEKARNYKRGHYLEANQQKCQAQGCENFIPEGRYHTLTGYYACSARCYKRRADQTGDLFKCSCGCGTEFIRAKSNIPASGLAFCSPEHSAKYFRYRSLNRLSGPLRPLLQEYLEGYATLHYRDVGSVRPYLARFFLFLEEQGITTIESVTPKMVTQFQKWLDEAGLSAATHEMSCISSFFNWALAEGRRNAANPVIPKLHRRRKAHRRPRPLVPEELELCWALLWQRGDACLRLAFAIGEEGGLRPGEICRLEVSDIDAVRQRIHVGLPNKTMRERLAFFGPKTKAAFEEWMRERDPSCGHRHLLHRSSGRPFSVKSLHDAFAAVLCKTMKGKQLHEDGLEAWSTHRLRHTMATTLVNAGCGMSTTMAVGGWIDAQTMLGYAAVDPKVVQRGYEEAMRRAQEQKASETRTLVLTPAEYLRRRQIQAVKGQLAGDARHADKEGLRVGDHISGETNMEKTPEDTDEKEN